MPKNKTVRIILYMLFQANGWGVKSWYRRETLLHKEYADKLEAMRETIAFVKAHGFTHALILEDYGRLNQKPYKIRL